MRDILMTSLVVGVCATALSGHAQRAATVDASKIRVWNGTKATLDFDLHLDQSTFASKLASNKILTANCKNAARIDIKTGDKQFTAPAACGGVYRLYYDDSRKQYALDALPISGTVVAYDPSPAPPGAGLFVLEQTPIQQAAQAQGAAVAAQAAAAQRAAAVTGGLIQ